MTIVALRPCLGIEPGHLAEARRALVAQGRLPDGADDDAVRAYLWAARALPAALDAVADQAAGGALGATDIVDVSLAATGEAPADGRELWTVAVHVPGSRQVEVRVVDAAALLECGAFDDGDPLEAKGFLVLRFTLSPPDASTDPTRAADGSVQIQRFVVGRS